MPRGYKHSAETRARMSAALKGRPRKPAIRVVPASELGWSPRSHWWVLDDRAGEAHGPFPDEQSARAAS